MSEAYPVISTNLAIYDTWHINHRHSGHILLTHTLSLLLATDTYHSAVAFTQHLPSLVKQVLFLPGGYHSTHPNFSSESPSPHPLWDFLTILPNLHRIQLQALCCLRVVSPPNKQAKVDERNGFSFKMATLD